MEGNFLKFKKVTNGIHSSTRGYFNVELFNLAHREKHTIPFEYSISQMDSEMLQNDFKKFQKVRYWNPDPVKWSWACRKMHHDYSTYLRTTPLTFEQAVQAAEKQTSPGYPWNLYFKTKGEVLQDDASYLFIRQTIAGIMAGDLDFALWNQSSPKLHEIRPKKKFTGPMPKVRTFMCCDIIFYLIGIMLYKNQNDSVLQAAYSKLWSAVGIVEEYGGWDRLAQLLKGDEKDPDFHCFDVEAMEASLQVPIIGSIYELRNSNLIIPPKHRAPWRNLQLFYLRCLQFPYVIDPLGFLIMMFGGNISGQLNTLNDNTFGLEFATKYSIALHFEDYDSFVSFWDTLRGKLMGDDSIIREHRLLQFFINDMATIGFIVKYESEPAKLTKSSFLNRSWSYDVRHGMYVSRPNFAKMLANVYFNKKNNSWRLTYVKLQALRVKFYAFPEKLYQIVKYINYVEKHHMKDMEREVHIDPILTMKATLATNLSNEQIEFMIYGVQAEGQQSYKSHSGVENQAVFWKCPPSENYEEFSLYEEEEYDSDYDSDTDFDLNVRYLRTFTWYEDEQDEYTFQPHSGGGDYDPKIVDIFNPEVMFDWGESLISDDSEDSDDESEYLVDFTSFPQPQTIQLESLEVEFIEAFESDFQILGN